MSRSLIRKNQLHPDIADLVSGYGSNLFISDSRLIATGSNLQNQINNLGNTYVTRSNGQFTNRPTVNGTGVLLQGEAVGGTTTLTNVVFTTGTQTISGSKNFTTRPTFNNQNLITTGDLVNLELQISNLPSQTVTPLIFLNIQENNNSELFDSNDVSNYKIPWNNVEYFNSQYVAISSTIDNTKYMTYNPTTKNLYIRESGIYNVDLRYSSYNLRDASDFLRARLRNWDTEIPGGLSRNDSLTDVGLDANNNPLPYGPLQGGGFRAKVLAAFAQGPIGTTFNGEAMCAGFTTFKITTPQYITADFLHVGALRIITGQTDQPWCFPVYLGPYGNLPFMFISKIV